MKNVKTHSLFIFIFITFLAVLSVSFSAILTYTYQKNTKDILSLSHDYISQINQTLIEKTINYLNPATNIAKNSSLLFEKNLIDLGNPFEVEHYTLSVLNPHPQLAALYIGDTNGNFIMTKRVNPTSIQNKVILNSKNNPKVIIKNLDTFNNVTSKEVTTKIEYDPRTRPWYKGGKDKSGHWTDVYTFYTGNMPGITASYPVFEPNGTFHGVIGIDIELQKISDLLSSQKISEKAAILMVSEEHHLIAYSTNKDLEKNFHGKSISTLNQPEISEAFSLYKYRDESRFSFKVNNKNFMASFKKFPESLGKKWIMVIIAPSNEFLTNYNSTHFITIIGCILILITSLILSWFLSRSITHPLSMIHVDLERIKKGLLDGIIPLKSRIKEIQQIIDDFKEFKENLKK